MIYGRAGYNKGNGPPPWKQFPKKGIGRQAEATLEAVWERTQWPNDETIAGLWDLHRVRREQVVEWFQNRRRKERMGESSVTAKEKTASSTNWDAEWDGTLLNEEQVGNE